MTLSVLFCFYHFMRLVKKEKMWYNIKNTIQTGVILLIRFNNDYNRGALPEVLAALENTNDNSFAGYGEDEWCERACGLIRRLCGCPDADIRFFPGATQANFVIISAALSPVQSVITR